MAFSVTCDQLLVLQQRFGCCWVPDPLHRQDCLPPGHQSGLAHTYSVSTHKRFIQLCLCQHDHDPRTATNCMQDALQCSNPSDFHLVPNDMCMRAGQQHPVSELVLRRQQVRLAAFCFQHGRGCFCLPCAPVKLLLPGVPQLHLPTSGSSACQHD